LPPKPAAIRLAGRFKAVAVKAVILWR